MTNGNYLTWADMLKKIPAMNEIELFACLNYELSTSKRKIAITTLHQRYCRLRDRRERVSVLMGDLL